MSVQTVQVCLCGDPKAEHLMGCKACRKCRACDAFELDGEVPTSLATGGDWSDARPTPHLDAVKAELAKVRAEYDEMAKAFDEADNARQAREVDLSRALAKRDQAIENGSHWKHEFDLAAAELASARTELERLRGAQERRSAGAQERRSAGAQRHDAR